MHYLRKNRLYGLEHADALDKVKVLLYHLVKALNLIQILLPDKLCT